ncbi:MAG: hypothetical protein Q7S40_17440 [Opitutaceae bacterium]|nr:hypothetical protein [Opitutaceae bacterium]
MKEGIAALVLLLCLGRMSAKPPTAHEIGNRLEIRWHGDLLLEIRDGRFLRFRGSGFNDHWLGTTAAPMDLGWDYRGVKDYVNSRHETVTTENGFVVTLAGAKPSIDGHIETRIEARLISAQEGFRYTLSSKLTGSQRKWRAVSTRARGVSAGTAVEIEVLDFHLNRISRSDLMDWRNSPGEELLYDGIVVAHKSEPWRFIPPVYTPYPIRKGEYPTIFWTNERRAETGFRIGYLDRREGGWIQEFGRVSAPIKIEQCWLGVDVHYLMPTGVPGRKEDEDTFETGYTFGFTPVTRQTAREILDRAASIDWRERPEYQLPVFSRYSTFEERLSRAGQFVWCASSYQCALDDTLGADDRHSVRITHALPGEKSAWYAFTWGTHFDTPTPLKGRFRISAMVKTRDCAGNFKMAVAKFGDGDIFLRQTGQWTSTGRRKDVEWFYSDQAITGTVEWTQLHVDVDIDLTREPPFTRHGVILEYAGAGSIWFDNVRIQQVE